MPPLNKCPGQQELVQIGVRQRAPAKPTQGIVPESVKGPSVGGISRIIITHGVKGGIADLVGALYGPVYRDDNPSEIVTILRTKFVVNQFVG